MWFETVLREKHSKGVWRKKKMNFYKWKFLTKILAYSHSSPRASTHGPTTSRNNPSQLSKSKHQAPKYYFICSLEYIQMFDVYKAQKVKISFACGIKQRLWVIVKTRNCRLDFLYLNEFKMFQQEDKRYELDYLSKSCSL